ncbi:sigma-54-dependent Fis family transcriptional regulator [Peribacillus simplex]|uniref:Sigma-54-dependent Fis family transcriptional regulator n=2 Tax=Peribacillus TaxID=2675229 RepID=A0AA90PEA5_9BACI|nr:MULTISPECIES: sigma-54-dependent Fis family transcriptional regulator [Peribacillus]MDP1419079.1 sigma-54-dependent Fis family transcriptional regulator [Peribacillus simplex]MDP1451772.1 sigma-54-dependent Fis family transcriptional regulator [Peribacillus frigoritolerans]
MLSTSCYLRTWERFVSEGVLDSNRLNKRIMESWHRCKKDQVNPYLNKGKHILTNELLDIQREKNSFLLEVASPQLSRMNQSIKESGMMALLVDPDGYVLSLSGNEKILEEAGKINFVEGVCWTEGEVGTNAIGTALKTGEAVMIQGTEHYSIASHKWSCSAMPILNEDGMLLGVLDISCPVEYFHPSMLGTVANLAYTIEQEMGVRSYKKELALTQHSIELAETYPDLPFIVCNHKEKIISASKQIRKKIPQSIGMALADFLNHGYQIKKENPLLSKEDNRVSGKCLFLSENHEPNRLFPASMPSERFAFKGERGISESFHNTLHKVKLVAPTEANVYISGETGVGKELIAMAIHENGFRKKGPFVTINCGAIPKDLMESELFGYVDGAFTGAKRQGHKGKFEQANGGTIFLDEIGEIPLAMQVALLRVLQERKIVPIGGTKSISLDIRIITATHRNLEELVNAGSFRKDLYYRLNVYPIHVPPLRERIEDIPYLVNYLCSKNNWNIPVTEELLNRLKDYNWPGNIRELQNVLQRLTILLAEGPLDYVKVLNSMHSQPVTWHDDFPTWEEPGKKGFKENELTIREKIQRDLMIEALQKSRGNVTAAAKLMDIPRSTFYKRLHRYGI